jgi:hypothetical protein
MVGEGAVEVRGVEPGQPIPQGQVGRRRLLRLDRGDPVDGLDDVQLLAPKQQLAAQGRPVELAGGELPPARRRQSGRQR